MEKSDTNQTQIRTLEPYFCAGEWVFDDDRIGLEAEAFVCGMSEILDFCLEDSGIDPEEVEGGFKLTFSKDKWPDSTHSLTWLGASMGGNDYELDSECRNLSIHNSDRHYDVPEGMKGWLCPTFCGCYFGDEPPKKIYLSVAFLDRGRFAAGLDPYLRTIIGGGNPPVPEE